MEVHTRRHRTVPIQDQENVNVNLKGKGGVILPTKRQGLVVRGALGDCTNVQASREVNVGKVAVAAAEFEKKTTLNRSCVRRNYNHVQSKIDTGLAVKNPVQPSARLPLRREESTAGLATRAAARTARAALKDSQNEPNEIIESINALLKPKKVGELKKTSKLQGIKEHSVEKAISKHTSKDPTESLEKLKLVEPALSEKTDKFIDCKKSYSEVTSALPDDVEDIDVGDNKSPWVLSIYVKDIYKCLAELEEKYEIKQDFLKDQAVITPSMRTTLISWLVEVQVQYSLLLETLHLAIGIVDRYLQVVHDVKRTRLQLVGMAAMFIASKYEEIYAPVASDFLYIANYTYTQTELFQCEKEILSKLGFCLSRPIPLYFLRRFVKAASGSSKNHHLAKYVVDLALVEYTTCHYRPSEMAAAAVCLSLFVLSNKQLDELWTPTLSYYSGYSLKHIEPLIKRLAKIVIRDQLDESYKHKAVFNKYEVTQLGKVSQLPQLKGERIFELANLPSRS